MSTSGGGIPCRGGGPRESPPDRPPSARKTSRHLALDLRSNRIAASHGLRGVVLVGSVGGSASKGTYVPRRPCVMLALLSGAYEEVGFRAPSARGVIPPAAAAAPGSEGQWSEERSDPGHGLSPQDGPRLPGSRGGRTVAPARSLARGVRASPGGGSPSKPPSTRRRGERTEGAGVTGTVSRGRPQPGTSRESGAKGCRSRAPPLV